MASRTKAKGAAGGGSGEPDYELWYKTADDILKTLKSEITNTKELIRFLKRVGYELTKEGKGDHQIFKLIDKGKFIDFVKDRLGTDTTKDEDIPFSNGKRVSVDTGGDKKGTIKGVLDRVFGLDSEGQKPKQK